MGAPEANGEGANSVGSVRMRVSLATEDVFLNARLTDVRNQAGLSDYTGELQARTTVRITDRNNGLGQDGAATVQDFDFSLAVPCAATDDNGTGGTCSVNTSLQALEPGAVRAGMRAIWELGQVRVYDGGPDGTASTEDNTLFAVQGIFVP